MKWEGFGLSSESSTSRLQRPKAIDCCMRATVRQKAGEGGRGGERERDSEVY